MKLSLTLLSILFCYAAFGQSTLELDFDIETVYQEDYGPKQLYELPVSHEVWVSGERYQVTGIEGLSNELAFCFEYVGGDSENVIPGRTLIIVENYKSDSPRLLVDENGNLDVSDDGEGYVLERGKPYQVLGFPVGKTGRKVNLRYVSHLNERKEIDEAMRALFSGIPSLKENKPVDATYWFGKMRQTIKAVNLESSDIQLGIMDWNVNGVYNDSIDRVLIGPKDASWLSTMKKDGAIDLYESPVIRLNNKNYAIDGVKPDGTGASLRVTDRRVTRILNKGDILADMDFQLIDGTQVSLYDYIEEGKFTLIDNWATWCRGCVSRIGELKSLVSKHEGRLNMLGLVVRDTPERVKAMVAKEDIPWQNGMITPEILEYLMVEGYPYLVLVNDKAEVLSIGLRTADEIEQLILGK